MKEKRHASTKMRVILRKTAILFGICAILGYGILAYRLYCCKVPDSIYIKCNSMEELDYHVPATGRIIGDRSIPVSLNQKVKIATGDMMKSYKMELKLFGVLPFKDVNIQVIEDKKVIPAGFPIGIYVKTEGVLVIDVGEFKGLDGNTKSPSKYILQPGDYILSMDGDHVETKKQIIRKIEECNGNGIMLTIKRDDDVFDVSVQPALMETGEYKIGVWLRDSAQGIGTMTYVDSDGQFGALGHGITDIDTQTLLKLNRGLLYHTDIIAVKKGVRGTPGELTGYIEYLPEQIMGIITENDEDGVYGYLSDDSLQELNRKPMEIGLKQNVEIGKAQIYCTVDDMPDYYDVEIVDVTYDEKHINRQITLKVTDPELLHLTGGIVQGMSGCPIIQNNRIIGAITHVLVNEPTKGYGIFIEDMLTK